MTDAKLITSQQNNCYVLPAFQLDSDDAYEARCAEIFITLNRIVVFHCSFCNEKYGRFEYLLKHLSVEHYETVQEQNICESEYEFQNDLDEVSNKNIVEDLGPLEETLHDYYELQKTSKFKVEVRKGEIDDDDDHSACLQYAENSLKLENVIIIYKPPSENSDVECTEAGKLNVANISSKQSSATIERKTDIHINAAQEILKSKNIKRKGVFKCDICNKIFEHRRYLMKHLITHSSERKHKCDFCGFAFKDPCNLKSHVRRCHTGKKNIGCDICSKLFYTNAEVQAHIRTHTGEKPYICSTCGLRFETSSKMTAHAKRHMEKAPHQCSYCKKEIWGGETKLKDHLLVHTKEKLFACPICSARFSRRMSMLRHTKLHEK